MRCHEQICCMTSCECDEKWVTKTKFVAQSRPALYFLTSNKHFLLHNKLVMQVKKKRKTSTQNLQRNNVAQQVEGSCISYFATLSIGHLWNFYVLNTVDRICLQQEDNTSSARLSHLNVFFWKRKTGFGIVTKNCVGCRILVKKEWECGIRTPFPGPGPLLLQVAINHLTKSHTENHNLETTPS